MQSEGSEHTSYPVVITYTTYHCGVCRAIVVANCKSHPTARVVSVENYTDGRPPSNPWNNKFLTISKIHDVAATITYQRAEAQKERNGHTILRTTEVAEKPAPVQKPSSVIGGDKGKSLEGKAEGQIKRGRGRPKGSKNKPK